MALHRQQLLEGKQPFGLRWCNRPRPRRPTTASLPRCAPADEEADGGAQRHPQGLAETQSGAGLVRTKVFQTQKVRRWLAEMELPAVHRFEMNLLLPQWELAGLRSWRPWRRRSPRCRSRRKAKLLRSAPADGALHRSGHRLADRRAASSCSSGRHGAWRTIPLGLAAAA